MVNPQMKSNSNDSSEFWDIDDVVKKLEVTPMTYNLILGNKCVSGTCQIIVRRKLNNLCKMGKVMKMDVPGVRFSKIIYYTLPKKYTVIVESDRMGSNVYYFFKHRVMDKFHILLDEYYQLERNEWKHFVKQKLIFEGKVLKWL